MSCSVAGCSYTSLATLAYRHRIDWANAQVGHTISEQDCISTVKHSLFNNRISSRVSDCHGRKNQRH